jgi:hypothetical protein
MSYNDDNWDRYWEPCRVILVTSSVATWAKLSMRVVQWCVPPSVEGLDRLKCLVDNTKVQTHCVTSVLIFPGTGKRDSSCAMWPLRVPLCGMWLWVQADCVYVSVSPHVCAYIWASVVTRSDLCDVMRRDVTNGNGCFLPWCRVIFNRTSCIRDALGGAEHCGVDRVLGRFLACERLAVSGRRKRSWSL